MINIDFSVLMSLYVKEKPNFLKESLDSVFSNTKIPSEVVLVKDGPLNDKLNEVIKEFEIKYPSRLKIVELSKNVGLGNALNIGLNHCKNEIVFRMDTDDISIKTRFEKQLQLFLNDENLSLIGSSIKEFNHSITEKGRYRNVPLTNEEILKVSSKRNPFNHMTVGFKKSKILEVGGYMHMPGYEDYYLWLRLLKKYKTLNIKEELVYARIGNNMISRRQGLDFFIKEFKFQYNLLNEDLISYTQFSRNIFLRVIPRLLPKSILSILYDKLLRNN